jgi:hypothetical protein
VSLAVGQQLLCDTCGTYFLAPILSSEDLKAVRSSNTDFEVVGDPWRGFQDSSMSDDRGLTAGRGLRAHPELGQTQQWQTADWDQPKRTDQGNPPAATSHSATEGAPSAPEPPPVSPGADAPAASPSSRLVHMVVCFVSIAVVGVCVGGGIYVMRSATKSAEEETAAVDSDVTATTDSTSAKPLRWIDATRSAQMKQRIIVKVETGSYGPVRVKDLNRRVITTDDDNLIALNVSVRNRGFEVCPFTSWYGETFETDSGDVLIAELFDDRSRSYQMLKFDDVSGLQGQRLDDEIGVGDVVRDTLVFVVPEDVDRKEIKHFRLALPAVAVGLDGYFRFEIPVSMITDY